MQMLLANRLGALSVLLMDALEGALGDLSPSAAAVLLTLYYRPDSTATALAKVVGIAQPTAVRVLDGLVRRGWIERRERIGRQTPLRLTVVGARRARSVQAARLKVLDRLLAILPKAERAAFARGLDALIAGAVTSRTFARTTCRLCDHQVCDGPRCPIGTRASALEHDAARSSKG